MANYRSMPANENMFDPELTTDKLLEQVRAKVEATVTTVDEAAELENRLSEEAASFNTYLNTISNCMHMAQSGDMTKEEAMDKIAPAVKALKSECKALSLVDAKMSDDDLSEGEIAMLREFIVGCKDIVAARKEALQDDPSDASNETETATEGVMSYLDNMEVAEESIVGYKKLLNSPNAKTANDLYKNSQKIYKMGSKEKALQYMKKAKDLYQKCLDAAIADGYTQITGTQNTRMMGYKVKGTVNQTVYNEKSAIAYFEDRIDSCDAYILMWQSGNDKLSLKELKKKIKAEKREKRAEARKAFFAKFKKQKAEEAALEAEATELMSAMEAMISDIEIELAMEAAMEADGEGAEGADPEVAKKAGMLATLGSKIKEGFGKLARAVKGGDKAAADKAEEEILSNVDQYDEAEKEVEANGTDEQKEKAKKTRKLIIAGIVVAMLAVGAVVGAKQLKPKEGQTYMGNLKTVIKGAISTIRNAASNSVRKVGIASDERQLKSREKSQERIAGMTDEKKKEAAQNRFNKKFGEGSKRGAAADRAQDRRDTKANWIRDDSAAESVLAWLANENCEDCEDPLEEQEGKGFEPDAQGEDMIVTAEPEGEDELDETATESAITLMMLESGLDPTEFD